jgi:hypothetical protein
MTNGLQIRPQSRYHSNSRLSMDLMLLSVQGRLDLRPMRVRIRLRVKNTSLALDSLSLAAFFSSLELEFIGDKAVVDSIMMNGELKNLLKSIRARRN